MKLQYIILDLCHKLTVFVHEKGWLDIYIEVENIHRNVHEQELYTTLNLSALRFHN